MGRRSEQFVIEGAVDNLFRTLNLPLVGRRNRPLQQVGKPPAADVRPLVAIENPTAEDVRNEQLPPIVQNDSPAFRLDAVETKTREHSRTVRVGIGGRQRLSPSDPPSLDSKEAASVLLGRTPSPSSEPIHLDLDLFHELFAADLPNHLERIDGRIETADGCPALAWG